MAKGIYLGIAGTARKVKKLFAGVNGTARKVKKVYVGVGGAARLVWTSAEDGQQVFTSSGTFTVPDGINKVDIFCVGGGQTGGLASYQHQSVPVPADNGAYYLRYHTRFGGDGGNGGQTVTKRSVSVVEGAAYSVIVGASDGNTAVGNLCTALAGAVGRGSGAGRGSMMHEEKDDDDNTLNSYYNPSNGGSDGNKGDNTTVYYQDACLPYLEWYGKAGQGTATRAFGESNGTLYAAGGGGGVGIWQYTNRAYGGTPGGGNGALWAAPGGAATPNTGSGGGGASLVDTGRPAASTSPGAGGSGIVIIRWYADKQ